MKKQTHFFAPRKAPRQAIFKEPAESTHGRLCQKCISSYNVEFPFDPYPAQVQLMYKILLSLKEEKNCLLESPTGTGKSLALLCSTLAWQLREFETNLGRAWSEKHPKSNSLVKRERSLCNPTTQNTETNEPSSTNPNKKKRLPTLIESDGSDDDDFRPVKKSKSYLSKITENCIDRLQSFIATPPARVTSSCDVSKPIVVSDSSNSMDTQEFRERCEKPQNSTSDHITTGITPIPDPTSYKTFTSPPKEAWDDIEVIKIAIRRTPKIYYGTRTHLQIKQVIRELSSTAYRYTPMTILGSREHLCVNPSVLKTADKTEGCKEAVKLRSCGYHAAATSFGKQDYLKKHHLNQSWDIEDLVSTGRKQLACPYYATRFLHEDSLIVFCPYNYLIDPIIKREMKFQLDKQIVVLDEAHNIENISRDSASTQLTQTQLDTAIIELDSVKSKIMLGEDVNSALTHLSALSQHLKYWLCGQDTLLEQEAFETYSHSWLGPEAVKEFSSFGLTTSTMQLHNQHIGSLFEALFSKEGKEGDEEDTSRYKILSSGTITMLEWLFVVLNILLSEDRKYTSDYIVSISKKPVFIGKGGHVEKNKGWVSAKKPVWERTLNFCCLNPAVAFESLKNTTHSIILTSGTLTPMTSFVSELSCEFAHKFSANHIIKPSQVWVGMLGAGPSEVRIEASFRGLEQFSLQDEIGNVLVSMCESVPDGVLCFLPSYSVMDKLRGRWESVGVVAKLCDLKHLVWEPRGSGKGSTFKEDMNGYFDSIARGRGSLLIAVCRGKVSEGIDFADAQARAVVCVGIPFPNWKDHQVQQKREYNDRRRRDGCTSLLSGSQWYDVEAFRALNQALGRCIRHRNDWGAILLLDARFNNRHYFNSLSKWARELAHSYPTFKEAHNSLTRFISSRTDKLEQIC